MNYGEGELLSWTIFRFLGWGCLAFYKMVEPKRIKLGPRASKSSIAQIEYASAIDTLMHAMHCFRLDISFAICKLSSYTNNPRILESNNIFSFFCYLKRTRDLDLIYNHFQVDIYSWMRCYPMGFKYANKHYSFYNRVRIYCIFCSRKRSRVTDIKLWLQLMSNVYLHCDSEATIYRTLSKVYN